MTDPYLPHRGSDAFSVQRYELELDYRPSTNALIGRALLSVQAETPLDRLSLDLVGLRVDKVLLVGRGAVRFRHSRGRLTVHLPEPAAAGFRFVLDVRYGGNPAPQRGPWGEVGWEELADGVLVAGEPDGAATWFPCNDRPGDKASMRLSVRTDSSYTVVGNGGLVTKDVGAGTTSWVYEQAEPMAPYLATVQLGRYDVVARHDHPVPQLVWAPPGLASGVVADTTAQPQMLELFVRLFGPYPFSSYSVVVTGDSLEIPLEAQSLSVFGSNHLDGSGGHERLVAHELAHQWFGNSLTVGSWQDIWLHEGFACYAEWLWSEESGKDTARHQAQSAWQRLSGEPQDLVLSDPGPERMFDDRVYKRGALALHALREHVGDKEFFALLRSWVARHRHGTVSTELFLAHVRQHANAAAAELLGPWLDEPALPPLSPATRAARS